MKLLTRDEVAQQLGVSRAWVSARVKDGTLPFLRLGPKLLRFRPSDLDAYVEQQQGAGCSTNAASNGSGGSSSSRAGCQSASRLERQIEAKLRSKLQGSGSRTTEAKPALLVVNGQRSPK